MDRLDQFETDVRVALGEIRRAGATPMLVTHANAFSPGARRDPVMLNQWTHFYPRADGSMIVDFDELAAQRVERVAADSAVPFADWHAAVAARTMAAVLAARIDGAR